MLGLAADGSSPSVRVCVCARALYDIAWSGVGLLPGCCSTTVHAASVFVCEGVLLAWHTSYWLLGVSGRQICAGTTRCLH